MTPPAIVAMTDAHAAPVIDIYRLGIATGHATFETEPPSWDRFTATRLAGHRFVALDPTGQVHGWVACTPVPENTASLALHTACGFRAIGTRERLGRHHGTWRDVVLIERRSPTIT